MIDLNVDMSLCFNCGACASVCPLNVIDVLDKTVRVGDDCNVCGTCAIVCPMEAIKIE